MEVIKNKKITNSLKWSFLLVAFNFISKFGVKIVLAKLLLPKDFGLITICFLVLPLAEIFSDCGLSSVIIQNKNKKDKKQLSTIFWFNCLAGIVIFLVLNYIITPWFVEYYEEPILKELILIISFSLLYNPIILIKRTFLQIDLSFKKIFIINLSAILVSSAIAVYMAFNNFGVWSLIIQYFSSTFIIFLSYFFLVKWQPKFYFDFTYLKNVLGKSVFDLSSRIVGYFSVYSHSIILAYFLSLTDIGFFNFALMFTISIIEPFNKAIRKVFFPFFSKINNDTDRIRLNHLKQIRVTMFIFIPFISFLFFYSEKLLVLVFDDKWLDSVIIIKYLSVYLLVKTMNGTPNVIIKSLGYFNHFFFLQLLRSIIMLSFLTTGIYFFNVNGLLIAFIVAQLISNVVDFNFIKKKINLSFLDLAKTIIPTLMFLLFIFLISYIQVFIFNPNLVLGIVISIVAYLSIYLFLFKHEKFTL